ncbi:MAG: hypothetical protein WAM60_19455 [Candidatus Promineifilaceae bacterium]
MESKTWKKEWLTALVIASLTALLLILPYLLGHTTARPETTYTGLLVNLEDGTYLSAIEQGRMGAWLYTSHFTLEAHEPVFLEGFYLFLGQIAHLVGLSTVAMWHLSLFVTDLILFLTIFGFISIFLPSTRQRFTAYFLALFGAGFDWWHFPVWLERAAAHEVVPIDLRFPEAHIFYSALTFPHFITGITFILLVLGLVLSMLLLPPDSKKRWWLAVGAGAANLLLGVVYPFLIFLPTAVLGIFYLWLLWGRFRNGRSLKQPIHWHARLNWPEIGMMAVVFLIPLPLFLYYAVVFLNSDFLKTWSQQAYTPSPNPLHYLLTYGPYLFLGILYPLKMRRAANRSDGNVTVRMKTIFLWIWVGAAAFLLYLPLNSQRRYVEGLHIPLVVLATIGFFSVLWPWLLKTRLLAGLLKRPRYSADGIQQLVIFALIGTVGLTNIYLYSSTLFKLGVEQPYPLFRPTSEMEAMAWLRTSVEPGDVVLAAYETGSFLPYKTGATVIVGNQYETADFYSKRQEAAEFFQQETTDQWRQNLLAQNNIRYVFVGPQERRLGGDSITTADYLEPVYQSGEVIIYRVISS